MPIPILRKCQILNGKWYNEDSLQPLQDLGFTIVGTSPDSNAYMVELPAGWKMEPVTGDMHIIRDSAGVAKIVHWYGLTPQVNIGNREEE